MPVMGGVPGFCDIEVEAQMSQKGGEGFNREQESSGIGAGFVQRASLMMPCKAAYVETAEAKTARKQRGMNWC